MIYQKVVGKMEKKRVLNHLSLEFPSLPQNIALARVAVASFAAQDDLNLNDIEEIKVAVSEAVSNCIIHGYQHSPEGIISIKVTRFEDDLEVIIEDNGQGMGDLEVNIGHSLSSDPERMGLGFVFMKSFMDSVEVISKQGKGTKVILCKNIVNCMPAVVAKNN
jgi:stage II sporulation protein AB (anti-sigma F factor)